MNILEDLKARQIVKDITNIKKIKKLKHQDGVYIGFDPSAPSLHLGNYIQIAILKRFEKFGFKPFAILGGATGRIGDPSGKSMERNLLNEKIILENKKHIRRQLELYKLNVIDNLKFYEKMTIIDFLHDVGKYLNVNYMLNKDIVKNRLQSGISFTEFSYQLIQGWDFKVLYDEYNVKIQIGGSDQWGNITTGLELIRKTVGENNDAVGLTTNLLTTASGKKFGKSENNALWLDPNLTSPYELYQYLFNSDDENVAIYLKWLTFLDIKKIDEVIKEHQKKTHNRYAQKILAYEVVKDIHGLAATKTAIKISDVLFGINEIHDLSKQEFLELTKHFVITYFKEGLLIDALVFSKAASSKREAREFIKEKAIQVNGKIITDEGFFIQNKPFIDEYTILKRGKKKYFFIKHS